MKLTDEQLAITSHEEGAALVTAGAGCGKTTVLVEFIVQKFLNPVVRAEKILVLTFSTKAYKELRTRLDQRFLEKRINKAIVERNLTIQTYDAFGFKLVRKYHNKFGYSKPPTFIDSTKILNQCVEDVAKDNNYDKKTLMKDVLAEMKRSDQSVAKTCQKNPDIKTVLQRYKKQKISQNVVDFEDMVSKLTNNRKTWLKEAAQEYRYLLVDEVQDTNIQQMKMLITLAKVIPTSVMVGDPKQSINGFRGAYAENWETIRTKLDTCVYQLTKTQRVPRASLSFINAIGEEIYSGTPLNSNIKGRRICLIGCKNTVEQAEFIADEIKLLIKSNKVRPEEIVCLGRTQRLLSDLSIALEGHDIETQELYREPNSSHEKGLRNLLRLTRWLRQHINKDGFVFPEKRRRALISWLKRLGAKTEEIDKIFQKMPKEGWKALSITSHLKKEQGKKWKKRRGPENPAYRRVLKFQKLIGQAAESEELEKAIAYLMDALRKVLRRRFNSQTFGFLMSDLSRLKINSRQFNGWDDLRVKKLQLPIKNNQNCVQLSTINGAKGKEWKYVFVIHCVQGILPIHHAKNDQKLNEERNLFYVAITRHKKALYLMEAPGSMVNYNGGKHDVLFSERSLFITPHKKYLCDLNATKYFLDHATDSKSIG